MRFFRFFAMLAMILCLAAGGRALAAEADMEAFRGAYLQGMNDAKGYHLELMFNGPAFQSNVIADGQLWQNGAAVAEGKLSWNYTDLSAGQTSNNVMPFYAERSGNVVVMYGQRDGVWQQENILEGFSWLIDAVSSEDRETRMNYAATVMDVKSENEGNGRQRMEITFDGKALADVKDKVARERLAGLSEAERDEALVSMGYLNAALAENNPRCTWMVDSKTGETVMMAADLTDVMRSYAKAVLQDSYDGRISLTKEETDLLASIGYYYNLQLYLVRNDSSAKHAVIPATIKRSAREGNLLGGINEEIVSAVEK